MMQIISKKEKLRQAIDNLRREKKKVSLVPTMGYIHQGHLEVIRVAKRHSQAVVVSIFVNPTQFNDLNDYQSYPRDLEHDRKMLEQEGVDVVFVPTIEEVYPEGISKTKTVLLNPFLTKNLCGAKRKGHFEGVMLVVSKLLNLIGPDVVVFGEKDYQQYLILKTLVQELLYPIEVFSCPIIREPNGLAMSSRNARLSPKGREAALLLYRSLLWFEQEFGKLKIRDRIEHGEDWRLIYEDIQRLEKEIASIITENPLNQIDYVQILDADTLHRIDDHTEKVICGLAVYCEGVRLIDNKILRI